MPSRPSRRAALLAALATTLGLGLGPASAPALAQGTGKVRVGERTVKELIEALKSGKADEGTIRSLLEAAESGDQSKLALLNLFSKTTSLKLRRGLQRVFVQAGPGTIGLLNEALRSPRENQRRATIEVLGGLVRSGATGGVRRLALLLLQDYLVRGPVVDRMLTLRTLLHATRKRDSSAPSPRQPLILPETLSTREVGPCRQLLGALGKTYGARDQGSLKLVRQLLEARAALAIRDFDRVRRSGNQLRESKSPELKALAAELLARVAVEQRVPRLALEALSAKGEQETFGTLVALGQTLVLNNKPKESEQAFRRALARRPFSVEALSGLAASRNLSNDFDGALEVMDRALAIEPRHGDAFYLRARLRWRALKSRDVDYTKTEWDPVLTDLEAAIKHLAASSASPAKTAGAYGRHGFLLRRRLRFESAIRDFDEAIKLCKGRPADQATWLAQRGFLHFELKRWQKAIQDFEAFREVAPPSAGLQGTVESRLRTARRELEKGETPETPETPEQPEKPRGKLY